MPPTLTLHDEEIWSLRAGVWDMHFARAFVRRIGPDQRRRFSDRSWPYGDPTYMGGSLLEFYDGQLCAVCHALFPALEAELFHLYLGYDDDPEQWPAKELVSLDGLPVAIPHGYSSSPTWRHAEEVLFLSIRGPKHELRRFRRLLAIREGEAEATRLFRWRRGHDQAEPAADRDTLVFAVPVNWGDWREAVHETLFETLIRCWEVQERWTRTL